MTSLEQLALTFVDADASSDAGDGLCDYHSYVPDRSGVYAYTHLIRHPGDGQRESRAARQKRLGVQGAVVSWKSLDAGDVSGWARAITTLMDDGRPRTFNRIVLELSAFEHTADTAFGKDPDDALWQLVADGVLWWSSQGDAVFFLHERFIERGAPA